MGMWEEVSDVVLAYTAECPVAGPSLSCRLVPRIRNIPRALDYAQKSLVPQICADLHAIQAREYLDHGDFKNAAQLYGQAGRIDIVDRIIERVLVSGDLDAIGGVVCPESTVLGFLER